MRRPQAAARRGAPPAIAAGESDATISNAAGGSGGQRPTRHPAQHRQEESAVHIILDEEEALSVLQLVTAQVVDGVELSDPTVEAIRDWRNRTLERGSAELLDFAAALNETLGNKIDDELKRTIRRRDYYRNA